MFLIPVLDVPAAPGNLIRQYSNKSSITITWDAPKITGHHRIIDYYIEIESSADFRTAVNYTKRGVIGTSEKFEHRFYHLQANTKYTVHVSAFNLLGRGAAATVKCQTVLYIRKGW